MLYLDLELFNNDEKSIFIVSLFLYKIDASGLAYSVKPPARLIKSVNLSSLDSRIYSPAYLIHLQ